MARFKKMSIASADPMGRSAESGALLEAEASIKTVVAVARAAARELPALPPSEKDRLAVLLRQTVGADNPEVARAAIVAAATLRCQVPFTSAEQDRKDVGHVARFLVWSSFGDVVDPVRAFTKANVDEHLAATATASRRSFEQRRYILYRTGRRLHPQQFPRKIATNLPTRPRHPVAGHAEIVRLHKLIPRLPARLGQRAQALVDLTYGAGARPADLRSLRATAITPVTVEGRAIAVVALPNLGGGVRQVPVWDPHIGGRLLGLAAVLGDRLVLAPHAVTAERNVVNRVGEQLRSQGHPNIDPIALRNRWVLDMAERVPAVLLQQLADLCELRILVDERSLVTQYTLRHAISILSEVQR
jgi:integrase